MDTALNAQIANLISEGVGILQGLGYELGQTRAATTVIAKNLLVEGAGEFIADILETKKAKKYGKKAAEAFLESNIKKNREAITSKYWDISERWEVKSGDRQFRQPDIRQLLTYCTLNYASGQYNITDYRFINPRAGVTFSGSLHDLVRTVAGCEPETLYSEIIEFLSRAEVSI